MTPLLHAHRASGSNRVKSRREEGLWAQRGDPRIAATAGRAARPCPARKLSRAGPEPEPPSIATPEPPQPPRTHPSPPASAGAQKGCSGRPPRFERALRIRDARHPSPSVARAAARWRRGGGAGFVARNGGSRRAADVPPRDSPVARLVYPGPDVTGCHGLARVWAGPCSPRHKSRVFGRSLVTLGKTPGACNGLGGLGTRHCMAHSASVWPRVATRTPRTLHYDHGRPRTRPSATTMRGMYAR